MSILHRICRAVLTGLLLMLFSAPAVAAPASTQPGTPEEALHRAFPQVKVDSFRESDVKGLYEVVSGQNIFYYYPEKDYLIFGEILTKDGRNLTQERTGELMAKLVKDLPLEKAVKIGNGRKVVVEFSDPDCDFCRKASRYFAGRTDVTRYVFLAALAHPAAITKIQYILNAEDRAQAYEEMFTGKNIPQTAPAMRPESVALAKEHLAMAGKVGVRATPTFFINGRVVVGANIGIIEELLKD